ncbi:2-C-methyl-D-erythritol 2,4-cyclodiphosphate synthase [uncultured Microbulbifer sp.]|uniref:2-C-methyl-D-erythritol 2,4-cyclodiphosphate synthase n=1 Tax=uncultured Microbulbifer sp. TaxID=348147 RepID=UPI002622E8D1|nr:2-C-methyl-D-erythritol 2,4-cyclodiphosphate synthase [uncultured Microbulbifer sp.]
MSFRIGQGIDVHAFGPGDHVVLGGVHIPHSLGLVAHSDGDVLLHALADALLGALALGDIGKHFPDTDENYSGADSRVLLRHVVGLIHERGYRVVNADATLIAQAPKMAPHIDAMRENIAADCEVSVDAVSVKATTSERLGFTGRKEGIAAQAVVLLEQASPESGMTS